MPAHDPFSFTSILPWLNHEWLSEVLLALFFRLGGWPALSIACALGVASTVAILAHATRRTGDSALGGWPVWALVAVILRETTAPRATLFADLAFAATLAIVLLDDEEGPARGRLWWCVALQLLWTQLHGGNPLGVVLLGLRFVTGPSRRRALVTAASALATLAGPYGARVHAHFLDAHAALPMIREWQSLVGPLVAGAPSAWLALTLGVAAMLAAAVELSRTHDARARFVLLTTLVFSLAALRWARFVTAASLVAGVAIGRVVGRSPRAQRAAVPAACAGIALALLVATRGPRRPGLGLDARSFPVAAVDWLRAHHPPGPMFNSYNFGGYLLWARPEERVFVDGRAFTVYDPSLLAELPALYADPSRFTTLAARYGLALAVVQRGGRGASLDAWLATHWHLAYRDALADVFVRDAP